MRTTTDGGFMPITNIARPRRIDPILTVILAFGFVASIFLPIQLLAVVNTLSPSIANLWMASLSWAKWLTFMLLAGWTTSIALRFSAHLDIRLKSETGWKAGYWPSLIGAVTAAAFYKLAADDMLATMKGSYSDSPSVSEFNNLMTLWVIWWTFLLGYIAKSPWDRAKAIIHDPTIEARPQPSNVVTPSVLISSLLIGIILIGPLSWQIMNGRFPSAESRRYKAIAEIRKACSSISHNLPMLASDQKIDDEELEVLKTLLANARAEHGIARCRFNPKSIH